ncbi:MAG: amino acid ABC transporter permease [Spirochaetaceae bacterium]|jgi:putative glutamine transport system permease protein|nr:amino acid ABC transporter permease [Spirochaetaceae bacterium]
MGGPFAFARWLRLFSDLDVFIQGFGVTLFVSLASLSMALVAGIIFGMFSMSGLTPLKAVSRVYVEFFQNTPLVIQVFFFYNALPYAGIRMGVISIGIIGIGLYHGAYVAEVVRAGILSIPRGQRDAAASQGFSYTQSMCYIILPQATKVILPPLVNQAVNLIKNTSVLALIAGGDLMYRSDSWASNGSLSYGPAYVVTGILYFILCFPLARWARRFEERLKMREHMTVPEKAAEEGAGE